MTWQEGDAPQPEQDDPLVQCWHYEPGSPCDWNVCRQPERLAAGDRGTDPARGIPVPRPASDHCRPGRCMALMCCSYECSQGRCPSIPAEFREPTP